MLEAWGINSEYGLLRDVLLGAPDGFRWLGEENAQYSALVRETLRSGYRFDRDLALRQHAEMVDAYRDAGVTVHLLDARDELPYGVYARDSSFMTPFGAVVTPARQPAAARRVRERAALLPEHEIPIYDLVSAGNFEGGDFNMIEPGCVLIGYTGGRGEEVAARQVGGWMEARGHRGALRADRRVLRPHRPDGLHAGARSSPPSASTRPTRRSSTGCGAADRDRAGRASARRWGSAATSSRSATTACSRRASRKDLNAKLRALGFTVYDPNMSQFLLAGGGVHCMAQPLRRDPA